MLLLLTMVFDHTCFVSGLWYNPNLQTNMVEGSWQKNYTKENKLYGIPTPSLEVHGDNNLVIIAAACCEERV